MSVDPQLLQALEVHLVRVAGDTIRLRFRVKDLDGNYRDVQNDTIRGEIGFATALQLATGGNGITLTDGEDGYFDVEITKEQSNVPKGKYSLGFKLEDSAGDEQTVVWGDIEIKRQAVD